jgi:hypothetical protein
MPAPARFFLTALALSPLTLLATAAGAADSVSIDLTGVEIRNATNQSRSSAPATIDPAYRYFIDFSEDTMVRGVSGLLALRYPNPTPLADIMEEFEPGSSAALHSSVINPNGTHPFGLTADDVGGTTVISGITVTFSMTLSAAINADDTASFSLTNVVVSPASLVGAMRFTSGSVMITRGCVGDINDDGGVDGADVEAFFSLWENGEPLADLNQDGGVDGGDVEFFFLRWESGC